MNINYFKLSNLLYINEGKNNYLFIDNKFQNTVVKIKKSLYNQKSDYLKNHFQKKFNLFVDKINNMTP